jgi:hypothetical protein
MRNSYLCKGVSRAMSYLDELDEFTRALVLRRIAI